METKRENQAGIVGKNLRRLRDKHRLTQHRLAARAGLSRATIAELEGGRRKTATATTLLALAEAMGERVEALLKPCRVKKKAREQAMAHP